VDRAGRRLGATLVEHAPSDRAPRAAVRGARRRARACAARARYEVDPPTREALEARLDDDLERGTTGLGPHLDDVEIRAGERDLRRFGSQGEQRLAVLSLLLAEADAAGRTAAAPPLLLLDDVLSELDERTARGARRTTGGIRPDD
jgi:recombinational DNA repair ATPase RecF